MNHQLVEIQEAIYVAQYVHGRRTTWEKRCVPGMGILAQLLCSKNAVHKTTRRFIVALSDGLRTEDECGEKTWAQFSPKEVAGLYVI